MKNNPHNVPEDTRESFGSSKIRESLKKAINRNKIDDRSEKKRFKDSVDEEVNLMAEMVDNEIPLIKIDDEDDILSTSVHMNIPHSANQELQVNGPELSLNTEENESFSPISPN